MQSLYKSTCKGNDAFRSITVAADSDSRIAWNAVYINIGCHIPCYAKSSHFLSENAACFKCILAVPGSRHSHGAWRCCKALRKTADSSTFLVNGDYRCISQKSA